MDKEKAGGRVKFLDFCLAMIKYIHQSSGFEVPEAEILQWLEFRIDGRNSQEIYEMWMEHLRAVNNRRPYEK